jgi:hypothetical protein
MEATMTRHTSAADFCNAISLGLLAALGLHSGHALAAQTVGATTPFTILEAEAGRAGGGAVTRMLQTIPPNALSSPELEASGRGFVELAATGAYVAWVNPVDSADVVNIRECIPDAPAGGGTDATLDLYVNGTLRQVISLTSRQTWVYDGTNGNNNGMSQTPATGGPHVFYDESRNLIAGAALHKGDTIMLRKDAANTASFYYIDCIDVESTAPKSRPANSLSVADYGATGTTTTDVTGAFNSCCSAAKTQGKSVWVPPGTYYVTEFYPTGLTMTGAGMWYSTLYLTKGQLQVDSDTLKDICIDASTIVRDQGIGGVNISGTNWFIQRVWVLHSSTAGFWAKGINGTVRDSRTSMTWGDGCNLNNGNTGHQAVNLLAENNFVRGAGDDGVTVYSDGSSIEVDGAILRNNTTVASFWANGLRIAGGRHVRAENNLLLDNVKEAGLFIGIFGSIGNDLDSAVVTGNVIVRCGGRRNPAGMCINCSPTGHKIQVTLSNNTIKDAQFYGMVFGGDVVTADIQPGNIIDHPAETAIWVQPGAKGSANFVSNQLINRIGGKAAFKNDAPSTFTVTMSGNIGFPDTVTTGVDKPPALNSGTARGPSIVQSRNSLVVRYFAPEEYGTLTVSVYNSSGRRVGNYQNFSLHKGANDMLCPIGGFGAGVYIVKVATGDALGQKQFIFAHTRINSR